METSALGLANYKSYIGGAVAGSPVAAHPRPSRLDAVLDQNGNNVERLVGLIDKLRAVRSRFLGEIPENPQNNEARALKSGHVGRLEDQAEGISFGLSQCHEIVEDILRL